MRRASLTPRHLSRRCLTCAPRTQLDGKPLTKNVPANLNTQQRNECIIELVAESPDGEEVYLAAHAPARRHLHIAAH